MRFRGFAFGVATGSVGGSTPPATHTLQPPVGGWGFGCSPSGERVRRVRYVPERNRYRSFLLHASGDGPGGKEQDTDRHERRVRRRCQQRGRQEQGNG